MNIFPDQVEFTNMRNPATTFVSLPDPERLEAYYNKENAFSHEGA
jgi:hypothetical protein